MSEHAHGHNNHPHNTAVAIPPMLTTEKEAKFFFKKSKVVDELGNELKRPRVDLKIPVPTFEGLVEALQKDEKVRGFVLDLVESAIIDEARKQVADEIKPVNTQAELDISLLDLTYVANIPKTERTGGGISKETWEAFALDYVEVLTTKADKPKERAANAAELFVTKFAKCKNDKTVLKFLKAQLSFWFTNSANAEDYMDLFKFLDEKIDTLLQKDSAELMSNL